MDRYVRVIDQKGLEPISPVSVTGYALQQGLDGNRVVVEPLELGDMVPLAPGDRWRHAKFAVPDPAVMGAQVAQMRRGMQPRLKPVALSWKRMFLKLKSWSDP